MSATIPCRSCRGTGRERMPAWYRDTLAAIGKTWTTTDAIQRSLGGKVKIKRAALCNRLVWLLRYRLVESRNSETDHRALEWRRA